MAEEHFEKTPNKANRWFKAAIVLALLYGVTFSLHSIFNWIFFFASAYSFFMSYFLLPVQPKIFQGRKRPERGWTGQQAQFNTGGAPTTQQTVVEKIKRTVFMIGAGIFALFVVFFIIGILNPEPQESSESGYTEMYADGSEPTAQEMVNRANDLFNNQEYDSAAKYYDRALSIDATNMEAVYGKGIVLYQQDRQDEAMQHFRQSYEGGFRFAWLSWVLADMNEKNGNTTQAIALYKESVNLDSSYVDSYKRLAELEPFNRDNYLLLAEKHAPN